MEIVAHFSICRISVLRHPPVEGGCCGRDCERWGGVLPSPELAKAVSVVSYRRRPCLLRSSTCLVVLGARYERDKRRRGLECRAGAVAGAPEAVGWSPTALTSGPSPQSAVPAPFSVSLFDHAHVANVRHVDARPLIWVPLMQPSAALAAWSNRLHDPPYLSGLDIRKGPDACPTQHPRVRSSHAGHVPSSPSHGPRGSGSGSRATADEATVRDLSETLWRSRVEVPGVAQLSRTLGGDKPPPLPAAGLASVRESTCAA